MKLKEWREAKGVKQKAVAEAVGVSRQTYCKREAAPWRMEIEQALAVCDFLGLKPEDVDDFFWPREVK